MQLAIFVVVGRGQSKLLQNVNSIELRSSLKNFNIVRSQACSRKDKLKLIMLSNLINKLLAGKFILLIKYNAKQAYGSIIAPLMQSMSIRLNRIVLHQSACTD